jgi:hypothetical protein
MSKRFLNLVVSAVAVLALLSLPAIAQGNGNGKGKNKHHKNRVRKTPAIRVAGFTLFSVREIVT